MGDRHDYVALEWVKGEIAETLKQARQALEAFVENPQDPTRMRFCLAHVHQVHGTLQMVEFYGAALLAEEMEQLTRALIDGTTSNQGEALEVLMQAILQMPPYLDRVQEARRDLPMVVLPLLNDLRTARGEKLLSETSLFSPDLSQRPAVLPPDELALLHDEDLPALLRKLRQTLQMALVGVIRNQDLPTSLGYMARVFARMETLCREAPLGPLWQIASGLVEGLANGSVANSASVRTLLRQVDKELKRLMDQGSAGINQAAPEDLIKNLLFYIAKAETKAPRINTLKARYRLDEALPDSVVVDAERARLAGPDRDAMRSVVGALCEELVRVKDTLDLFVRSDRKQVSELNNLLAPLKQIGDTLGVLGFGQPRKVIVDQLDVLQTIAKGQREPSDALLMDIAGALLYVEATLAGMAGPSEDRRSEENVLPTTDVEQIHQVVIKEARNGLEQAKDAIIEFIASQWDHEHLARVPELLTQARGGLAMIPLPRAAALLSAATRYIQEQLLVRKVVPNWQSLDTLADALTGVEYYLERISEDRTEQGDLILDVAEESLAGLGYPLQEKPSILDAPVEQVEPLESAVDPLQEIDVLAAEPSLELEPETAQHTADETVAASEGEIELTPLDELPEDLSLSDEPLPAMDLSEDLSDFAGDQELSLSGNDSWTLTEEDDQAEETIEFSLPEEAAEDLSESDELSLDLGELSLDELATQPPHWEEVEIDLDLPEVELPQAPEPVDELSLEPSHELSMADVMAAPVQAINPPAHDVPPSILPPPADEELMDEDLLEVFIEEAGEVLETIGEYLPRWCANTDDKEAQTEIRRAFHTLKGSGRMVRALIVGELSWAIENLLNRVLDRSIAPTVPVQQAVHDVVALLPALVEEFAAKAQRQRDDVDALAAHAHALARGEVSHAAPVAADPDEVVLDPQLLEIFRNEAESHLETLAGFLADCAQELPQPITDDLQRALHTLKGSAYMAGILPMAELAAPLEKLAKEFKANLINFDMAEAELLGEAARLFQIGLDQLDTQPLEPVAGSAELQARIQQLLKDRLETSQSDRLSDLGETRDPQMIGIFLAQGMDILLDADELLRRWREHPTEQQELNALLAELTTLSRGAEMAELPQVSELCQALLDVYAGVQAGQLAVSEGFFNEAEHAHEALIDMMDQLAAGLQVTPQPQRVEALRGLLEQRLSDEAQALLEPEGMASLELTELDAEPEPEPKIAPIVQSMGSLDAEMVEIFLEEAVDVLESAGQALDRWLAEPESRQALSSLQRDLHTLKGGARMAEVAPIGDLAHELESLYEGLMDRRYNHSPRLVDLLQQSHDALAVLVEQLQAGEPLGSPAELIDAIQQFRQSGGQSVSLPIDQPSAEQDPAVTEEAALEGDLAELPVADLELPGFKAPIDEVTKDNEPLPAEAPDLDHLPCLSEDDEELQQALPPLDAAPSDETTAPELGSAEADLAELPAVDLELPDFTAPIDEVTEDSEPLPAEAPDLDHLPSLSEDDEEFQQALPPLDAELSDETTAPELRSEEADLAELPEADLELPGFAAPIDEVTEDNEPLPLEAPDLDQLPSLSEDDSDLEQAIPPLDASDLAEESLVAPNESLDSAATVGTEAPVSVAMEHQDPELVEIFLEEGFDIVDSSSASLQRWMSDTDNSLELESLQRDLHTLKGGARMAEISPIGDLAHELEFLYEGLGDGRLRASPPLFGLLQQCHDRLAEMLEAVRDQRALPEGDSLIAAIRQVRSDPDAQLNVPNSVHLQAIDSAEDEAESEILDIFLEEGDELLEDLERDIGRWESARDDAGPIDDLMRTLHTLKGGARLAGQKRLGDLAHDFEHYLGEAQKQGMPWAESLFVDVQSAFDGMQGELEQLRQRLQEVPVLPVTTAPSPAEVPSPFKLDEPLVAASAQQLNAPQQAKILPFVQRAAEAALEAASRRAPQELVKVPADLLEGLVNLAGETSIFRGRVEQQVSDLGFTLGEMDATIDRVRDQLRRLDTETQAQILSRYQAEAERAGYEDFDPLEMDRHSHLQQLSRSLFESASDLLDLKETLAARSRDAETLLLQQARVNTELQEGLMRTRMVPFDRLIPRLRRIVRQVAGELGKQVEFLVGNAEGEMDRTVLERIVAPLEHMLRNAVDHGIEMGDQRQAAGKSAVGTIRLEMGREGGDILLTLADDGGGIKLDAVRRKAIERGLMDSESDLTDHEILQFILEAGFSTAEKVTQISGRGVGMDVVHSEVKQLGGSMSIESTAGEGTRFLIRLPFTVSVNRALMVLSGEDLYAIPLNTIEGIVRVSPYELEALYQRDEGQTESPRFEYAGQAYELRYLGDLLSNGQSPKLIGQSLPLPVILVRSKEHAVAIQVDSLAGSREIVVKSMGRQFAGVHGISGATILGDGRVVVILDLLATIRSLHTHLTQLQPRRNAKQQLAHEQEQDRPTLVMVVDDSVTVRKVTTRLLERAGMNALTAKDGVDAITQLQEHRPDIILLDVEMPRMDGFEVATLVRHDERLKDIPIIMITSRTGEKHRQRAMSIGVNEYLGKPYQESLLLEAINKLVKGND